MCPAVAALPADSVLLQILFLGFYLLIEASQSRCVEVEVKLPVDLPASETPVPFILISASYKHCYKLCVIKFHNIFSVFA